MGIVELDTKYIYIYIYVMTDNIMSNSHPGDILTEHKVDSLKHLL